MIKEETKKLNLATDLKRLSEIVDWFESQADVDVEQGLNKVKEAAGLIKNSKKRLTEIENEFEEIKKEIDIDEDDKNEIEQD
ncbi:exodeoxyribonuclease VII small subunit [Patescibacteria group bacterium]|nr:exodeoxyribonuclease VII small subunit [Patescibacteria group bacterium]MBU4023025.1 exodeoxyribonuclease VII small subunit [Patescibacteria group bacterium]MBU4078096.1 exodeoxyribonuclease VII small subunit [Patescibacteria group bacterium]